MNLLHTCTHVCVYIYDMHKQPLSHPTKPKAQTPNQYQRSKIMNFLSFSTLLAAVLVLIAASLLLQPSSGISSDVLSDVCSNTTNPKHCEAILKSDPRTIKADLPNLSLISIKLTGAQAHSNLLMYLALQGNTTNESLKKAFGDCVEYYHGIETRIGEAYRLSFNGTYYKTFDEFSQVLNQAHRCAAGIPINSISYVSGPLKFFSFFIEISESVIHLLLITN